MQTKNTDNQDVQVEIKNEEENGMEILRTQNENVTVVDIPEPTQEANKTKEKDKNKHVPIYKQFFIKRVYTTAILAFFLYWIGNIAYRYMANLLFGGSDDNSTNQKLLVEKLTEIKTFYIIYVCVIAPIIEEFIFRSIIFKIINWIGKMVQKQNRVFGIIIRILAFLISSFIFAFGHFGFKFKILAAEILTFPPYFIMGLALAFAYNRDNYLLSSIFTHMINNILATLVIFLIPKDDLGSIYLSLVRYVFKIVHF